MALAVRAVLLYPAGEGGAPGGPHELTLTGLGLAGGCGGGGAPHAAADDVAVTLPLLPSGGDGARVATCDVRWAGGGGAGGALRLALRCGDATARAAVAADLAGGFALRAEEAEEAGGDGGEAAAAGPAPAQQQPSPPLPAARTAELVLMAAGAAGRPLVLSCVVTLRPAAVAATVAAEPAATPTGGASPSPSCAAARRLHPPPALTLEAIPENAKARRAGAKAVGWLASAVREGSNQGCG